jgi:hypothetical protein
MARLAAQDLTFDAAYCPARLRALAHGGPVGAHAQPHRRLGSGVPTLAHVPGRPVTRRC